MVTVKKKIDESYEDKLQALHEEFLELKSKISELRKSGINTDISDLLCIDFEPKIKMARATYDKKDLEKLRILLDEIKKQIEEDKNGTDFNHIMEMIKEAYELLREKKIKEAGIVYNSIMEIYKRLDPEFKKIVYRACIDIHKKIDDKIKKID